MSTNQHHSVVNIHPECCVVVRVRGAKRAKELDLVKHHDKNSKKFFSFYEFNAVSKNIGP